MATTKIVVLKDVFSEQAQGYKGHVVCIDDGNLSHLTKIASTIISATLSKAILKDIEDRKNKWRWDRGTKKAAKVPPSKWYKQNLDAKEKKKQKMYDEVEAVSGEIDDSLVKVEDAISNAEGGDLTELNKVKTRLNSAKKAIIDHDWKAI